MLNIGKYQIFVLIHAGKLGIVINLYLKISFNNNKLLNVHLFSINLQLITDENVRNSINGKKESINQSVT